MYKALKMTLCGPVLKGKNDLEPIEVTLLKQQLAKLKCPCLSCRKCKERPPTPISPIIIEKDVQTEVKVFADQNTQMETLDLKDSKPPKDVLYRTCLFLMNIILNGKKTNQIVLKDEGSYVKPWSSDKSVDNIVNLYQQPSSNFENIAITTSHIEVLSHASQVTSASDFNGTPKKGVGQKVTFEHNLKEAEIQKSDDCVCMDKFLSVFRPPLGDWQMNRDQYFY